MIRLNYKYSILVVIISILLCGNSYSFTPTDSKQLVLVIDPGHGGKDPGAVNKSIKEKNIVLAIGLKLGKLINENHSDVKVIFTRSTDVFIPLIERSRIANKNKADLFISIHANACPSPSIRGTETFFLGVSSSDESRKLERLENSVIYLEEDYKTTYDGFDPNSAESYIIFEFIKSEFSEQSLNFAGAIQQQFKSKINSPDRGVKQAGFLVLRQSSMPSVLVEAGFVSNQAEANYLNSEEGQDEIALSIYEAFRRFKAKRSGVAISSSPVLASIEKVNETTIAKTKQNDSVIAEKKDDIKEDIVLPPIIAKEKEPKTAEDVLVPETSEKEQISNIYYSIQIGANTKPVEPVAGNFKGLKNIRREKNDQYYRYYVGSENSLENIKPLLQQVKQKFPQAFIVSFVDGARVPLNAK